MAVQLDAAYTVPSVANQSALGWTHPVSGNDRLLLIAIGGTSNIDDTTVPIVGTNATPAELLYYGIRPYGNPHIITIWYVVAPEVGEEVPIIWTALGNVQFPVAMSMSFTGVNQTTPFGSVQVVSGEGNPSPPPTVVLSGSPDDILINILLSNDNVNRIFSPAAGQTLLGAATHDSGAGWAPRIAAAMAPGGDDVSLTWTYDGGSQQWLLVGTNIQAADGSGGEPAEINDLSATADEESVTLMWTPPVGASSQRIHRSLVSPVPEDGSSAIGSALSGTADSAQDATILVGSRYYYKVSAVVGSATVWSNEVSAVPNTKPYTPSITGVSVGTTNAYIVCSPFSDPDNGDQDPGNSEDPGGALGTINDLQATIGDSQVALTWTPAVNATSHQPQYRVQGSGSMTNYGSALGPTASGSTVSGLANGVSYEFRVVASNDNATTNSNIVVATPQASGIVQPFFADDFTGGVKHPANGFTWGGVELSDDIAYVGTHSIKMAYGPYDPVDQSPHWWHEERFNLGRNLQQLWIEFYVYFPDGTEGFSARYVHAMPSGTSHNNKFVTLWSDEYGGKPRCAFQLWSTGSPDYDSYINVARTQGDRDNLIYYTGGNHNFVIGDEDRGRWIRTRVHVKVADIGQNNGVLRLWKDDTLLIDVTNDPYWDTDQTANYIRHGYFGGYDNSGFAEFTNIYYDNFKFYDQDPGW